MPNHLFYSNTFIALFIFSHSLLRFIKLFICFYFVCNLYVNAIKASVCEYKNMLTNTHTHTHTREMKKAMAGKLYRCLIEFILVIWETFGWRVNAILDCLMFISSFSWYHVAYIPCTNAGKCPEYRFNVEGSFVQNYDTIF